MLTATVATLAVAWTGCPFLQVHTSFEAVHRDKLSQQEREEHAASFFADRWGRCNQQQNKDAAKDDRTPTATVRAQRAPQGLRYCQGLAQQQKLLQPLEGAMVALALIVGQPQRTLAVQQHTAV